MLIRTIGWFLAAAFFVLVVVASGEQKEQPGNDSSKTNVQVLMRDKLNHAQAVLDGIVTEDYGKIVEHADIMHDISRAASWQALDTDEYKDHSRRFQRTTMKLKNAAEQENRDAVTLQHLQLTIGCIECHQYLNNHD